MPQKNVAANKKKIWRVSEL